LSIQFSLFPQQTIQQRKKIKMRFTIASATLAAIAAATSASAANTQVTVGNGALAYSPSSVTAAVGDTISFVFYPKNHTVTQTTFAAPCVPIPGGVDSSFQPVAANATQVPSFTITVNSTDAPLWFSCQQPGHCESGMVFAVNPTANKTFAAFQAAAKASSANGAPASNSSTPSASGSSGSGTTSQSPSGTGSSSSTTTTSSKANSAMSVGAQAGGLLAAVGLAAGVLL
jgi:plastocyanin